MKFSLPLILSGALLAGCSTSARISPISSSNTSEQARLAAFAARNEYPNSNASQNKPITALVSRDKGQITLINASDQPLNNVKVWVNQSFVTPLGTIPSHGTATLPRSDFYSASGTPLSSTQIPINSVTLEMNNNQLVRVQGPAFH